MDWACYFGKLKEWKQLPAYRLEPRIDSFIGYYLSEIVSSKKGKIEEIIPEFPIKKDENRQSYHADFLLLSEGGPHYLVEVKTDSKSIRQKQVNYYREAKKKKLDALITDINDIKDGTRSNRKYKHLIDKIDKLKFIGKNKEIEIIYVQPSENKKNKEYADIIFIYFDEISEWIFENKIKDKDNCEFEKELCMALRKWKED